jgi:hypothetical protein
MDLATILLKSQLNVRKCSGGLQFTGKTSLATPGVAISA